MADGANGTAGPSVSSFTCWSPECIMRKPGARDGGEPENCREEHKNTPPCLANSGNMGEWIFGEFLKDGIFEQIYSNL